MRKQYFQCMSASKLMRLAIFACMIVFLGCKAYPKKQELLIDVNYRFYFIDEEKIKELKKRKIPSSAIAFPQYSTLAWKKYFSVLAYQKTKPDLRLISTIFTRNQVRVLLPLFMDAHALINNGQRLLVVANDYPYRSTSSTPLLTNFMIWMEDSKIHIIFGSINEVIFSELRLSMPKFRVNFKKLKILQYGEQHQLVIPRQLKSSFYKQKVNGITQHKWLITDASWFMQKPSRDNVEKTKTESQQQLENFELEL